MYCKRVLLVLGLIVLVFTVPLWLDAAPIPGSQYFYLSNGISYYPLGASGVAHFMGMDSNLYNPAGFADIKRITADLTMGAIGANNFMMNLRGSFPTIYGILTGNMMIFTSPQGTNAGDIFLLKGTFSKYISDEWIFGAGLNVGYGKGPEGEFLLSTDLGIIYRVSRTGQGLGLFDYSIGGVIKNLGKNISYTGYDGFPPLGVDVGGRVEVYRSEIYNARLSSHILFPLNPPGVMFGIGLENIFLDMINFKAGLNLGVEGVKAPSIGFDLIFPLEDTDIQFSYSMVPVSYSGSTQYSHNAGLSVAFGTYDKKPPEVEVSLENPYFSPNHDGINDRAKFLIHIKDNTMVFGWRLDIFDENDRLVKSFYAEDVRKIRHMTVKKFVNRIFAKKEEVKIPEFIEWDGEDSDGNLVSDGTYFFTLSAWDENNNKTATERQPVYVDTVVPLLQATLEKEDKLFSPNNDGVKDTIEIKIESDNIASEDKVEFTIEDSAGNAVLKKDFTGEVPDSFVWDGKNDSGVTVDEGIYTFRISAQDKAGNRSESTVEGIIVKTRYEKVSVSPSLKAFSPNGDGYSDINEIKLFASSKEGLINWTLEIIGKDGKVYRTYSGEKDFPDVISFDGKDDNAKQMPDGLYTVRFRLFYDSGNHPEAYFKFIRIDTKPPLVKVSSNLTAFSPNGDGVKDTVTFIHEIEADKGDVFIAKIVDSTGATFKTFDFGTTPPGSVVWNGIGDGGVQPVEGMYTYIITGKDSVGNITTVAVGPIKLVTGFEKISIQPEEYVFSPNGDGVKDKVRIKLYTDSREGIVKWKVDIVDDAGKIVRAYDSETMGAELPEEIIWDGKDNEGARVEDGIYTIRFNILYDTGNNPVAKPKDVKIDTKPPEISVYIEDLYVSPNDDGVKETLTIFQNIKGEVGDRYIAEISDFTGKVVKRFEWESAPPAEIVWDGRDEEGNPLPEGYYTYEIKGFDNAGNSTLKRITGIVLVTSYETVSIVANRKGISPNGDGYLDDVEFVPSVSSVKDLEKWFLDFYDSQAKLVRSIQGKGIPPSVIKWDGRDDSGKVVADGIYTFVFGLIYKSGNHPTTPGDTLIVDDTPPKYRFVVSPRLFSPDGDGEADTLYINVGVYDVNDIDKWSISIYRKWGNRIDRTTVIKRYEGKGNYSSTIKWNGYSDPVPMPTNFTPPDPYTYKKVDGKWSVLVDSAANYVAELYAVDTFGNEISVQREFETDILVIPTEYGLKIMINSIQFEFDSAALLPESFQILDRLIEILEKFPNYKVKIVGHTDSIGSEEYNQRLSEKRALSVYRYLVEHDVDKERLTTEGRGESQPIDDNNTEQGRARNRRVEFYLTKKTY